MPNSLTGGQVPPRALDTVGLVDQGLGNAGISSPSVPGLGHPLAPEPLLWMSWEEQLQPLPGRAQGAPDNPGQGLARPVRSPLSLLLLSLPPSP